MESLKSIIQFLDTNLVLCLLPIILTLFSIKLFFKNQFETQKALSFIRWFIILYTLISLIHWLAEMLIRPNQHVFMSRAIGPYKWSYILMLVGALVFPFTLLIKKLGSNFLYILLVAFVMRIGFYFERFVILTTSFHRDYQLENENGNFSTDFLFGIALYILQGILFALTILGILEILKRIKK